MRARDILDTTHQLEGKGMNRRQAETITTALAAAVEPLATKEELAAAVAPLATKAELAEAVASLATKEELAAAVAPLATKAELAEAVASLATKEELAAAVAPLATKEELAAEIKLLATKQELADAIKPLATKLEVADEFKILREKDLPALEKRLREDIGLVCEKMIESTKVWLLSALLTGLLAIAMSIVVFSLQVAAAAPESDLEPEVDLTSQHQSTTAQT